MSRGHMILLPFFFNPQGDYRLSWRHPRAPGKEFLDFNYYRDLVASAEASKVDAVFIADHLGIWNGLGSGIEHYSNPRIEPLALVSALSAVTKDIGFIVTGSSSFTEPFNLARTLASIDHISGGRVGWNVVTSGLEEEAMNFGHNANIDHGARYERAGEYLDIAKALWDSWDDDAVVIDKRSGIFAHPDKVHFINHSGKHFKVRGPLNVTRPPQGHPVIVQAGSSDAGKDLAAKYAELHFAILKNAEQGIAYRNEMDARLGSFGRTPDSFRLIAGVVPIVGQSAEEAKEKQEFLESLMVDEVAIDLLSTWAGVDLSQYPADGPVPDLPQESNFNGWHTWLRLIQDESNKGLSIRQLARKVSATGSVPMIAGTASQVADELQSWFESGAVDGFILMFQLLPEDWKAFMSGVVPLLQQRGLSRTAYQPGTLRDRLGLARPASSFVPS